ncbi:hypothetical protein GCM10010218_31500 [Streptomyces mashuensis]|uniref:Uncharacterized protein n=1 Tax=Streptomyces mashuensis TaxID=33904 RepID=A0A919B347_9ACTN|nr:hypothetical protein [Streptomyces mashuensis]GHF47781.1 hypothetical protein GCM10010218_31500 [Streptomyces mashuensis]
MDFDRKARRARLRLLVIGATVAALVVGGVVFALTYLTGGRKAVPTVANPTKSAPTNSPSPGKTFTPGTARPWLVRKGQSMKDGVSVGFTRGAGGALSAAVRHQQELDILSDSFARKQLSVIVSRDSQDTVDRRVSEVRKMRERAGLPPSGDTPGGLSIITQVKAARIRALDDEEDVVEVWMSFDRYATTPDKPADNEPLRDETTYAIYKWQDGDWKLTEEPQYKNLVRGPVTYDINSPYAWQDQWRRVVVE